MSNHTHRNTHLHLLISTYILVINVTAACDRGCAASVGLLVTKDKKRKEKRDQKRTTNRQTYLYEMMQCPPIPVRTHTSVLQLLTDPLALAIRAIRGRALSPSTFTSTCFTCTSIYTYEYVYS